MKSKKNVKIKVKIKEVKPKEKKKKVKIKEVKLKKPKKIRTRRQRRIKPEIEHIYIPKHELLSEEEKNNLFDININPEKTPHILISDPAICHLEVKVGDIIRIKRTNPIVGETIYYRQVVTD